MAEYGHTDQYHRTEKTDVMIGTMPPGLTETDIQGYISSAEPEIAGYTVTVVGSDTPDLYGGNSH